ncbi:hypothetical protein Tco_1277653 [Tanacetum coccineum]
MKAARNRLCDKKIFWCFSFCQVIKKIAPDSLVNVYACWFILNAAHCQYDISAARIFVLLEDTTIVICLMLLHFVPADSSSSIPADNVPAGSSSSIPADYLSAGHVLVSADRDRIC